MNVSVRSQQTGQRTGERFRRARYTALLTGMLVLMQIQRKSTAGSALDSISERLGIKTPSSRGNTADGLAADPNGLGVWCDVKSGDLGSKRQKRRSAAVDTSPQGLEEYVNRTQNEKNFADRQQQFHADWQMFRDLKAEVDGESSDDGMDSSVLPAVLGRKQSMPGRRAIKSISVIKSRGAK